MLKKSQFKNLLLQQELQDMRDYVQQSINVQPAFTLPIRPEASGPLSSLPMFSVQQGNGQPKPLTLAQPRGDWRDPPIVTRSESTWRDPLTIRRRGDTGQEPLASSQSWMMDPKVALTGEASDEKEALALALEAQLTPVPLKTKVLRGAALLFSALLVLAIYLTWHAVTPTSASPTGAQPAASDPASSQASTNNPDGTNATGGSGTMQVYIIGAVLHPGIYTLPVGARVYQLVQAAGGTLPGADLVSLNLAAKLSDGQEIYILSIGETPPSGYVNSPPGPSNPSTPGPGGTPAPTFVPGQLVNINTASETEMRQVLHVSALTAQKIIAYRLQHGPYNSIDQLLQVISKTIYDRIKNMVTV